MNTSGWDAMPSDLVYLCKCILEDPNLLPRLFKGMQKKLSTDTIGNKLGLSLLA